MRRILFWLHLVAGVVAGAVILVMSVTGVLLTYERQLTAWADGHRVASPPGVARLPVETLAARVHEARGAAPSAITLRADPTEPAAFGFGREATVFVDPYSGIVLGEGSRRVRVFFRMVTDWHRWLGASGERRSLTRAVTGAANLAFLFIVLSGIALWWPRGWTARHLRPVTLFQGGLEGKARDFNWHTVFGFWSALPLVFVVASAIVISYPWASDLAYRLTGSEPPRRGPGGPGGGSPPASSLAGVDRAWARAEAQVPGWQTLSLRLPATTEASWVFSIDTSAGARRPDRRTQLTVDRRSGEVVKIESYAGQPAGRKIVGWLRFIHTGEAFGVSGQTVAGMASAGGVLLVWTGLSLALRRLAAWRRRQSDAVVAAPADEPTVARCELGQVLNLNSRFKT
jgi:uncharacterized iron-regulated membrane protein